MFCYLLIYKVWNCITLFILMESNAFSGTSSLSQSDFYIWGDIYLKNIASVILPDSFLTQNIGC